MLPSYVSLTQLGLEQGKVGTLENFGEGLRAVDQTDLKIYKDYNLISVTLSSV